jgi:hypothetical protein
MTWTEAFTQMQNGRKVTHSLFLKGEYMTLNAAGYLVFNDGVTLSIEAFFFVREEPIWQINYTLIK